MDQCIVKTWFIQENSSILRITLPQQRSSHCRYACPWRKSPSWPTIDETRWYTRWPSQGLRSRASEELKEAKQGEVAVAVMGPTVGRHIEELDEFYVDIPESVSTSPPR